MNTEDLQFAFNFTCAVPTLFEKEEVLPKKPSILSSHSPSLGEPEPYNLLIDEDEATFYPCVSFFSKEEVIPTDVDLTQGVLPTVGDREEDSSYNQRDFEIFKGFECNL